jgi:hypothetical protein
MAKRPESEFSVYSRYFGGLTPEEFGNLGNQWSQLSPYFALPEDAKQRMMKLLDYKNSGANDLLAEEHRQINGLINEGKQIEAIDLVNANIEQAKTLLTGDEVTTALIYLLRDKGLIQEHLAVHGSFSQLPLTDSRRNSVFGHAVKAYMEADLSVGAKTDYALRIAECVGYMRQPDLKMSILVEMLGPNVQVINSGSVDHTVAQLSFTASDVRSIPGAPHGSEAVIFKSRQRRPRIN